MSRHTTSFTTDPVYRARQELRNRLERIREEAHTTAACVGEFPGNETEQAMWVALDALCEGYINGINMLNEAERLNKTEAASAARRPDREVGWDLDQYGKAEPA